MIKFVQVVSEASEWRFLLQNFKKMIKGRQFFHMDASPCVCTGQNYLRAAESF